MTFEPKDPCYEAKVRDSFARQQFMTTLGAQLTGLTPGLCVISLPYCEALSQQHGFFHGGVVGTLADTCGGYAAYSLMPPECSVLTVEYKLNLLVPGEGEQLIGRGRVVKPGRTLTICQSEVFAVRDGQEKLCATALVTLMCMAGRSDRDG